MCQACDRSVVLIVVRCQESGMCQSAVRYDSEMAGARHVPGDFFSMVVRWQVSGRCQECCSL